jgi:putrescine transport system permease protein
MKRRADGSGIEYLSGRALPPPNAIERLHYRLLAFAPYAALWRVIARLGLTWPGMVIALPYAWLGFFFLLPFLIVLKLSFAEVVLASPPYTPLFSWVDDAGAAAFRLQLTLENYLALVAEDLYLNSYLNSLKIAALSTLMALVIGFPMAYGMARAPQRWRWPLLVLVILPFWTSFLIRVYAWIGILKNEGFLNALLLGLGVIDAPLVILNTDVAVYFGIVYSYLPFMVLPLYAALEKMDLTLLEAAADLGCRPIKAFWLITVPLARPGIIAGCLLVFIPAAGEFVTPDLLGGADTLMIGKTLWVEFFQNRDWPLSSAAAVVLVVLLVVPIVAFERLQGRALSGGGGTGK